MSYIKTNWETGDLVTATKLNKIEQGIADNEAAIAELDLKIDNIHDIFLCEYGTTTYDEVMAAVNAGLLPCVIISSFPPSSITSYVSCLAVYTSNKYGSYTSDDGTESGSYVSAEFMSIGERSFCVYFEKYTIVYPSSEVRNHWAIQEVPVISSTQYDSVAKKLYSSSSLGNSNIVTVAQLKEDMNINNVASLTYEVVT